MIRRFASIGIVALALGARAQPTEAQSPVTRVHGIATGLAACWRPPHDDDQVTVRISFTREGAVIGEPRIVFVRSSGGRADDAALADSMMSAIRDCTPLHFSARLGAAIAGQVLAIRFIGRSRATIVARRAADVSSLLREIPAGARLTLAYPRGLFPDLGAIEGAAAFIADSLKKQGLNVEVSSIDAELLRGERRDFEGLDMLVTRAQIWRLGVRDALNRFSTVHRIGSNEIDERNAQAENEPNAELLRSIEQRLIQMGALRVLVEERAVWAYDPSIAPFFGPDGAVANLGAWARG